VLREGERDFAGLLRRSGNPATRVGRWLLFSDGRTRRMWLVEYAAVRLRLKDTVAR
jgi:hypothetical protein